MVWRVFDVYSINSTIVVIVEVRECCKLVLFNLSIDALNQREYHFNEYVNICLEGWKIVKHVDELTKALQGWFALEFFAEKKKWKKKMQRRYTDALEKWDLHADELFCVHWRLSRFWMMSFYVNSANISLVERE